MITIRLLERTVPSLSFSRLLSDIGQSLGMPSLAPSRDGVCQLAFDGRHLVDIVNVADREHILVSCSVGPGKVTAEQAMLVACSNFMQAAGGTVACTAPDGRLMLQMGVSYTACQANTLLTAIEGLLNQVETWEISLSRGAFVRDSLRPELSVRVRSA